MAEKKSAAKVGWADVLALVGLLLVGAGMWFVMEWAGVLLLVGAVLVALGAAEARKG